VHKSAVTKKFKDSFEVKEIRMCRPAKRIVNDSKTPVSSKKQKQDSAEESQELYNIEEENVYEQIGEIEEGEHDEQSVSIL
jgi:hypothetical protein